LLTLDLPSFTGAAAAPQLALVAGGTGIAPLAQIISHCVAGGVLERCQVMLLYSSRTVEECGIESLVVKIYGR
jgi:NAD(P)H-flavin reductase